MLVRTTKRIAGFPPPGKVGEVDDEKGRAAVERGDAEDMSSLSTRLRRPEPSRPNHPPEVEREVVAHSPTTPGGWSNPDANPALDVSAAAEALTEHEAEHPNDPA